MSDLPEVGTSSPGAAETVKSPEGGPKPDTLPKEVTSAGVSMHPASIPIPPPVADMGVAPAGANIPMPTTATSLPISDEQIAQGFGKSIRESFRWLAEWCLRKLKQVHVRLKSIHGKLTRVTTHA